MLKTNLFKLTCHNCGTTIGFITLKYPIKAENYNKGIT